MRLTALLLLSAAVASAQTTTHHKRPCDIGEAEPIPHTAVEPPKDKDQQPFCPRPEYELKWFLSEETRNVYTVAPVTVGYSISYPTEKILVFKPMCVLREDQ